MTFLKDILEPKNDINDNASAPKENFDYLDLLKAVAIYFVVLYHFNDIAIDFIHAPSNTHYLNYYLKSILSICVPIFFFVNGALLLHKKELDIGKHFSKIIKLCLLVIFWGTITLIALMYNRHLHLSLSQIFRGLWEIKKGWIDHIWFLEALVVIYIFFPLLFTAFKQNIKAFYFFFGCVMLLTFGNTLLLNGMTILTYTTNKFNSFYFDNYFSDFNAFRGIYGYSLGYFMLGGLIFPMRTVLNSKKYQNLALVTIPLAMLLLSGYGVLASKRANEVWDIVWYGYDHISTLINVVSIFILSLRYKSKGLIGKLVSTIGKNSLGIYFVHIIIGDLLQPYFLRLHLSVTFLSSSVYAFCILFLSLFIVLMLKKLPFVKQLFTV